MHTGLFRKYFTRWSKEDDRKEAVHLRGKINNPPRSTFLQLEKCVTLVLKWSDLLFKKSCLGENQKLIKLTERKFWVLLIQNISILLYFPKSHLMHDYCLNPTVMYFTIILGLLCLSGPCLPSHSSSLHFFFIFIAQCFVQTSPCLRIRFPHTDVWTIDPQLLVLFQTVKNHQASVLNLPAATQHSEQLILSRLPADTQHLHRIPHEQDAKQKSVKMFWTDFNDRGEEEHLTRHKFTESF